MKKSNIRIHENKNSNTVYTVKRGRGPSNYIVISPYEWEEDRRFTNESAAQYWVEYKNVALANERRAKAKLATSS